MISDNFVTGDNIYLRELQNFFFEALGMMSITHYGAIGDGRTDNYGAIQVAIDDANRRHLDFIYVPYGRYIYTGELINIGNIEFIGNPHAKIINIRTGEEIEVKQFGWAQGIYYTKSEVNALLLNSQTGMTAYKVVGGLLATNEEDLALDEYVGAGDVENLIKLEDGVIKIGEGVTKVKVSATFEYAPKAADLSYKAIKVIRTHGETTYESASFYDAIVNADEVDITRTIAIPTQIINVAEGDTLTLRLVNFKDDYGYVGKLTAEVMAVDTIEVDTTENAEDSEEDNTLPNPDLSDVEDPIFEDE